MDMERNLNKAYEDPIFINSKEGRSLRMLAEYYHPQTVLKKNRIYNTVVFFGSARSISTQDYNSRLEKLYLQKEAGDDVEIKIRAL
jgi:hypothetical protein